MGVQQEHRVISDSEWQVMRVIWTKQETTAKEVYDSIHTPLDWKMSTVKTLLGRLVTKEWVETTKQGKRFLYRALLTKEQAMQIASEAFLERVCAQEVGQTIGNMVKSATLTAADMASLQQILAAKVPVDTIQCTCLPGQCNCH